ncbi:nitronate monooxygenase [Mycobacterium barrassiae]|nr:nitronate monooxygenase [Mycobacterium barrassiae]MCV7298058.1 nitronate monooxygenase [Mycobacterium barrassiae]
MDLLDRWKVDRPIAQAGMGNMAPPALAAAVARAGGLGTIGMCAPTKLKAAIDCVRQEAPGRSVAVNLLMPFANSDHIEVCIKYRVDVAVIAFGGDAVLVERLQAADIALFVLVGTESQARTALDEWGADGLFAQGEEAGGHLAGRTPARSFLPTALAVAGHRPVLLAGGIADSADTRAAMDAGAAGVVAGTRFLLTHESGAHPAYQQRLLHCDRTIATTLFGLSWPARHRVATNEATRRWCHPDGTARRLPSILNAKSAVLARLGPEDADDKAILRLQRPALPIFTPAAPTKDVPDHWIERAALYGGDSALRMHSVVSAAEALSSLSS